MAITHDYTLVCEFARMEMGGKFIIIGLFTNGIGTPMIPFPLPSLTFYNALRADAPGTYNFTGTLAELTTGNVVAQAKGQIQAMMVGPVVMPIQLPNLQFRAFGSYTWSLEIAGQSDPFVTDFQIAHVPPQVRFMPPEGRIR
jgi:hypothetical protein